MKLVSLAAACNGVTRIVSALRAYHNVRAGSKNVDDLSFTLVAPLSTDNNICSHKKAPFKFKAKNAVYYYNRKKFTCQYMNLPRHGNQFLPL